MQDGVVWDVAKGKKYLTQSQRESDRATVGDFASSIIEIHVENVAGEYMLVKEISYDPNEEQPVAKWVKQSDYNIVEQIGNGY